MKVDLLDIDIIIELECIAREKQCKLQDTWAESDSMKRQLLGYIF